MGRLILSLCEAAAAAEGFTRLELMSTLAGEPLYTAYVRPGDLIVAVDGRPVETVAELQRLLVGERIGASVTFTVARHERVLDIAVVPHELAA